MPIFRIKGVAVGQPRVMGIGFDLNTWDFSILENDSVVAVMEVGDSQALLEQIRQALGKRDSAK